MLTNLKWMLVAAGIATSTLALVTAMPAAAATGDNSVICSNSTLSYSQNMRDSNNIIRGVIQLRYCSSNRTTYARALNSGGSTCDGVNGNNCPDGRILRINDGYNRTCLTANSATSCTTRGAGDIASTITSARANGSTTGPSWSASATTSTLTY